MGMLLTFPMILIGAFILIRAYIRQDSSAMGS
jgi:prolipoprotein diacylglyceryltransferase